MAAHETILAHVLSLAQLRSAPALAAIGRELDRNPHLRFQRFGTSDPPRTKIDTAEAALGSWRPGPKDEHRAWTFFLSRPADPAGRASLDITTMDPTRARYAHDVSATYRASHFTNTERLDEIADLLRRVAEATGAFYGRAALGAIYDQHNLLFERVGRPPTGYECELPDVYWLNYLGPGYVQYFGDCLAALGSGANPRGPAASSYGQPRRRSCWSPSAQLPTTRGSAPFMTRSAGRPSARRQSAKGFRASASPRSPHIGATSPHGWQGDCTSSKQTSGLDSYLRALVSRRRR